MQTAAEALILARSRSGLSQHDLGARAGVPQSAISAYERGRKQPSVPTLARLIGAAGFQLDLQLEEASAAPPSPLTGPVGKRVQRSREALRELLITNGFGRPQIFGSVARGEDRSDSDVDLLVDLPAGTGLVALAGMRRRAADLIGADVDLVPREGLRHEVAAEIDDDLVTL